METLSFRERRIYFLISMMGAVLSLSFFWYIIPPISFPSGSIVTISEGSGLHTLAEKLREDRVIRSPFWFRITAILLGGERRMKAGEYYMSNPQSVFTIAWRVVSGDHDIETVKVTVPEGFTAAKISELFDEKFPLFDNKYFLSVAPEGYLFPDTYFVPVTATASSTIKLMRDNFEDRIREINPNLKNSDLNLEEIIIMASIIEREAETKEGREIVSDILWKRLKLGIPLQVDASFAYVNGKTTKDLTTDDLKIDSPFNTYLYPGLPPSPIANPGLEGIQAALNPTTTPYLYFLTGDDGTMHYSKTHDEHVAKKLRYIK